MDNFRRGEGGAIARFNEDTFWSIIQQKWLLNKLLETIFERKPNLNSRMIDAKMHIIQSLLFFFLARPF